MTSNLLSLLVTLIIFNISNGEIYTGPWRKELAGSGSCWTEASCNRVLTTSHGGDWGLKHPYDSMPAFQNAFKNGADAVKGDFRVSSDNIGMVMHSSPVEFYESLNCFGKYVEKMTAAECQQCKMALTNFTFTSVPDLLTWSEGRVNVMLCVKEDTDVPRAISTLIENKATQRAFLEVGLNTFLNLKVNNVAGWDQVYYVVHMSQSTDIDRLLLADASTLMHAFLVEFDNWPTWPSDVTVDIQKVKSIGLRTFAATRASPITATVDNHLQIYSKGFDVAYTYNLGNAVTARIQVNTERGLTPP